MNEIAQAVRLLRAGCLVAFPTETVYGLGADATRADAVEKIFQAKGRPPTNPLIVHVADMRIARRFAAHWPDAATRLAEKFWPGPLTIVLKKTNEIPDVVTAGLDSVGLRVPDHPIALQLLHEFAGPLAAPSANRSNHVSPTTADHVRAELGDSVDLILDGGPCRVGIESTVLDLSTPEPKLLRPGGVSREQLESLIGPIAVFRGHVDSNQSASSPGQQLVHYSPKTPAYRFESHELDRLPKNDNVGILRLTENAVKYAHDLYAELRRLDEMSLKAIFVELPPDAPGWQAVRDRVVRATGSLADQESAAP